MACLFLSIFLLSRVETAALRSILALIPMIPAFAMCWVVLRQLRRMDELQRRIQLEAMGFAFAGTALITFSYGFLEVTGFEKVSMFLVWPVMAVLWVIGTIIGNRRYR
ncbi:hypothetical protein N7E02_24680 [Aliirhizobium terrae]|uniref:hypothetical protein n=1 Tax=Terrirhizobium terrae TaxID=2926709 RepID=UPI0025761C2F|nr:hypothetical protein [Rhizobium sp. CC-CFT758]WJH39870.1 hypothetical protein N7E02_24680 [Rhizobium sp. CC-CFT758]